MFGSVPVWQRERIYLHTYLHVTSFAGPAILRYPKETDTSKPLTSMQLFIHEDEHGWIYEPHGSEIEVWCTTFEGSEVLKASGWRPYEVHRVSRHVHASLLIDGLLFSVP